MNIQSIPASKLVASPKNVRQRPSISDDELMSSIATLGVIQNLVVAAVKKPKGSFEVIAGGRRLNQVNRLISAGTFASDYALNCLVIDADADATLISLNENFHREDMNPADEALAFKTLMDNGADADTVAKSMSVTSRYVMGRMRLCDLAPEIFQALAAGDITLDVAQAFTVRPEHDLQQAIFSQFGNYAWSPEQIRTRLTAQSVKANSPSALLVGREAYIAAGGKTLTDLFASKDEELWTSPEILEPLVAQQLAAQGDRLSSEMNIGRVIVYPGSYVPYNATEGYVRYDVPSREPTEPEAARMAELEQSIAQYEDHECESDQEYDEIEAKIQGWQSEIEAVQASLAIIPEEDREALVQFATLAPDGSVVPSGRFLVARERAKSGTSAPTTNGNPQQPDEKSIRPISAKLSAALAEDRTNILRLYIASNPTFALSYRTEAQIDLQQFSTPPVLGALVCLAANPVEDDRLLEPSAGTGLLAAFFASKLKKLHLNELDPYRAELLRLAFPQAIVDTIDGARIHYSAKAPTLTVLNPPYSRTAGGIIDPLACARHFIAAVKALKPGGRAVAIMPSWFKPFGKFAKAYESLSQLGTIHLDAELLTSAFAKHGTGISVRIIVMDKIPGKSALPRTSSIEEAISLITALPPRARLATAIPVRPLAPSPAQSGLFAAAARLGRPVAKPSKPAADVSGVVLSYTALDTPKLAEKSDGLYIPHRVSRIAFEVERPHPTALVESAAMASVLPPPPSYRPQLTNKAMQSLSEAQLETVIYAGQSFDIDLPGTYRLPDNSQLLEFHAEGHTFRRGFFLGDGTGAGKGRQVAAIIMDQWLRGNRRHIWISKSSALVEDARRDWKAIGGMPLDIRPLDDWKLGSPISMDCGILFLTYATLRSERADKGSRVDQILTWLKRGTDDTLNFEGVIAFDEAHAMANAAPQMSSRGIISGSDQGIAGLRLQNLTPRARVLYVSATGAVDVANLSYAARLGLWGHGTAFKSRENFISTIRESGVSAMEIVARDLKSQGLYTARALSFKGVEYDILEHALSAEQIEIYDTYAEAWQIIHQNLQEALRRTGIVDDIEGTTLNKNAKSAAISRFESTKQRFFSQVLLTLKLPSLFAAIDADLEEGHSAVVQLVSTAEAMLNRRIATASPEEIAAGDIDLSPREYVFDYLENAFPTVAMEPYTDEEGKMRSRPLYDSNGNPVHSPEALEIRANLFEKLGALPGVATALDELIRRYGEDQVAEITGRSKRMLYLPDGTAKIQPRSSSANLAETAAFMEDRKRILVFSDAGGTGRSYHADRKAQNKRRRIHYLLEPGWKAAEAVQGLGRTHRTDQDSAPIFRPVTTNVRGEKRFISTIARRLDALGALTRGQRQTGGQNLFNPADNLESPIAATALTTWYHLLVDGKLSSTDYGNFHRLSGLDLLDNEGSLREDLPPIQRWLNRILAFPIATQNAIFDEYFALIQARVDALIAAGRLDTGLESYMCDRAELTDDILLRTDPVSHAESRLLTINTIRPVQYLSYDHIRSIITGNNADLYYNARSKHVAAVYKARSIMTDEGDIIRRLKIQRPESSSLMDLADFNESHWEPCSAEFFETQWQLAAQELAHQTQTTTIYLVSGLLLPIWSSLPEAYSAVLRIIDKTGQAWLGRAIDAQHISALTAKFGVTCNVEMSASDILFAAEKGRSFITIPGTNLSAGYALVNGQKRIEIKGYAFTDLAMLKSLGGFTETIAYKTRLFIADEMTLAAINTTFSTVTKAA